MGQFLHSAQLMGITNVTHRRSQLQKAAGVWSHNEVLFYICGYDYITAPSANKFRGLKELYLTSGGDMSGYLNLGTVTGTNSWTVLFKHAARGSGDGIDGPVNDAQGA